jgi:hypothetical protein
MLPACARVLDIEDRSLGISSERDDFDFGALLQCKIQTSVHKVPSQVHFHMSA